MQPMVLTWCLGNLPGSLIVGMGLHRDTHGVRSAERTCVRHREKTTALFSRCLYHIKRLSLPGRVLTKTLQITTSLQDVSFLSVLDFKFSSVSKIYQYADMFHFDFLRCLSLRAPADLAARSVPLPVPIFFPLDFTPCRLCYWKWSPVFAAACSCFRRVSVPNGS